MLPASCRVYVHRAAPHVAAAILAAVEGGIVPPGTILRNWPSVPLSSLKAAQPRTSFAQDLRKNVDVANKDSKLVRAHLRAGDSCSSSGDLTGSSRSKRMSVSRRFPRLSTSHIVGMLKIPYCRANLFSQPRLVQRCRAEFSLSQAVGAPFQKPKVSPAGCTRAALVILRNVAK